jgi:hypothetical protein
MQDCSRIVDRGYHKSYPYDVYEPNGVTIRNLDGATVTATMKVAGEVVLQKNLLILNAALGKTSLEFNPAESRLIPEGRLTTIEIQLIQNGNEIAIGRGMLTGVGGGNSDL